MKRRHNKKRNTALVYEALIKEATAAILRGDQETKNKIVSIVQDHFGSSTILRRDLQCYQSIAENQGLSVEDSRRILRETKMQKAYINPAHLFKAQSEMIKDINTDISSDIFNNFVPNYKVLATIDQMFSPKTSPKDRVLLENQIIDLMTKAKPVEESREVDGLVVSNFVEKFNNKYSDELLEEQRELLTHYILSFSDNALSLKMFLNGEIARLKEALGEALEIDEIKTDKEMTEKTNRVVKKLENYAAESVTDDVLLTILKTQKLVKEIHTDGSDN